MVDRCKMASFLGKNWLFFERVLPSENRFFFNLLKPVCSVQIQDIYQNSLPRKKIKMAEIFKMAFALFCCMKICFVSDLFGLLS
jgi:hypothetical protein